MIKEEIKFIDSNIFEGMTSISAVIRSIELGISNRRILRVLVDNTKTVSKAKEISFLRRRSTELCFSVELVEPEQIIKRTVGNTHGGIIAECSERLLTELSAHTIPSDGVYYYLDGIEDPYNFGNALRSIYAFGADGLIVGERNWYGAAGVVARASAGASELLPAYVSHPLEAISAFKQKGYRVLCAGIRDSISISEADLSKPLLVILGGEKRGISREILNCADSIVRLDYGTSFNGSLSASASSAVFAFEILKYNKK